MYAHTHTRAETTHRAPRDELAGGMCMAQTGCGANRQTRQRWRQRKNRGNTAKHATRRSERNSSTESESIQRTTVARSLGRLTGNTAPCLGSCCCLFDWLAVWLSLFSLLTHKRWQLQPHNVIKPQSQYNNSPIPQKQTCINTQIHAHASALFILLHAPVSGIHVTNTAWRAEPNRTELSRVELRCCLLPLIYFALDFAHLLFVARPGHRRTATTTQQTRCDCLYVSVCARASASARACVCVCKEKQSTRHRRQWRCVACWQGGGRGIICICTQNRLKSPQKSR